MSVFDDTYARIKLAANASTQAKIAKVLGIRQSTVSDAKKRESIPPEWFLRLHDNLGVNIDWLRGKDVPMYNSGESLAGQSVHPALEQNSTLETLLNADRQLHHALEPNDKFVIALVREEAPIPPSPKGVMMRVYDTVCDYDDATVGEPDFMVQDHILFPEFLISKGTRIFAVNSDVMAPTLRKGAHVGVAKSHLISGEVYAVLMPLEGVVFRRIVQDAESGMFLLCFDQQGLPISRLSATTLQSRLLGKVLWTLQTL